MQVGLAAAGGGVLLFLSGGVAAPSVSASLSAVGYVRRFAERFLLWSYSSLCFTARFCPGLFENGSKCVVPVNFYNG